MTKPLNIDPLWLDRIAQTLTGLEFGTVQIVVHDGRIVQLEKTERRRFDTDNKISSGKSNLKRI